MATTTKFDVTIISDLACPWCYVGEASFEKAVEQLKTMGDYEVSVQYRSYVIDWRTNPAGEEYLAYNVRRWGGDGWVYDVRRRGKPLGLNFAKWTSWPYTLHAHRLLHLARKMQGPEGEGALMKVLFKMTYEEGENISLKETLVKAAERVNLPGAAEMLHSKELEREVIAEDNYAKEALGVGGVPYFIIGCEGVKKKYSLDGAQRIESFVRVFQTLESMKKK